VNENPMDVNPTAGDGGPAPDAAPEGVPLRAPGRRIRGRAAPAGDGDGGAPPAPRARNGGDGDGGAPPRGRTRGNGGAPAEAEMPVARPRGRGNGGGGGDGETLSIRRLLTAMRALRAGDFTVRLPDTTDPLMDEIFETFNEIASTTTASRAR
jgi:hypothetical protein